MKSFVIKVSTAKIFLFATKSHCKICCVYGSEHLLLQWINTFRVKDGKKLAKEEWTSYLVGVCFSLSRIYRAINYKKK